MRRATLHSGARKRTRRGFTLIEVLVVSAILGVLLAILLPALSQARQSAHQTTCASNLRQWAMGISLYVQDHDATFPPASTGSYGAGSTEEGASWRYQVQPYIKSKTLGCPATEGFSSTFQDPETGRPFEPLGYALNHNLSEEKLAHGRTQLSGKSEGAAEEASRVVLLLDARGGFVSCYEPDTNPLDKGGINYDMLKRDMLGQTEGAKRHRGGANYAFVDGHVKWYRPEALAIKPDPTRPSFAF